MVYHQYFHVAGQPAAITYDSGLTSTEAEKKRLIAVNLVSSAAPADNAIQGYWERQKVFDIPDRLIDYEDGSTDAAKPGARLNRIEVAMDIPVGETFRVAILCGATATDIYGTYEYEILK
jgi:hypothetical protein